MSLRLEQLRARTFAAFDGSWVGRVYRGSVLVRALTVVARTVARSLSGEASWLGRAVARWTPPSDFLELQRLVRSSLLGQGFVRLTRGVDGDAWRGSALGRWVGARVVAADLTTRVRVVAWCLLSALLSRALVAPQTLTTSAAAVWVWAAALGLATGLFAGARPVGLAWAEWVSRRHARSEGGAVDG